MPEIVDMRQFWAERRPLPPSPVLETLAGAVLEHSTKRSPIWKFRLAPDLILSIQPKVGVEYSPGLPRIKENLLAVRWFYCRAVEGEGVDVPAFLKKQPEHRLFKFQITAEWQVRRRGMWNKRGAPRSDYVSFITMQERIEAAFAAGFFDRLNPERMLGRNCIICGKGLTDPVSMARLIGPECFGSASADLPWITRAAAE